MFTSISGYLSWLSAAPDGTTVPAKAVYEQLAALDDDQLRGQAQVAVPALGGHTARERFWTSPADMRVSAAELAEGLGRPRSWVYRHTSARTGLAQVPHRKESGGELVFVVGEVRDWLKATEIVAVTALDLRRK